MADIMQVRKLTTIQRLAMKAIIGCFRTTPTAALEIETGLQPTWLRLQSKVLCATTRMQTLSANHPLQTWLAEAMRTRTACTRHQSNLENILQQFPYMTEAIETIEPHIRPPWWTSEINVNIKPTKDEAKDLHNRMCKNIKPTTAVMYTDGSGIESKIGAALYNTTTNEVIHQHLGKDSKYNVFAAEVTALQMAAEKLWDESECVSNIFTDSQAAIKAIINPRRQSGQAIIKEFLDCTDDIMETKPQQQITITWIPGHTEIQGNERADAEAKKAAMNPKMSLPFKYKPLKSARLQYIKKSVKEQWLKQWNQHTQTSKTLRRLAKQKEFKVGPKLYNSLPNRSTVATIIQLRTGHCRLNKYLHSTGAKNSPYCECGYGKETVEHYLLECIKYREQMKRMRLEIKKGRLTVGRLLGDPKMIKHTMKYVKDTARLEQ
jgi:ribonuclease HI